MALINFQNTSDQISSTNDRGLSDRVHYIEARNKAFVCNCQTPYSHANAEAVSLVIERVELRIMRQTRQETCSKDEFVAYSRREKLGRSRPNL